MLIAHFSLTLGLWVEDENVEANPIERRLEQLRGGWERFAVDPRARLLHWVIEPDEWKVVETFFTAEEELMTTQDLFLRPTIEFEDRESFSLALIEWLRVEYEKTRPDLAGNGVDASWSHPPQRETHSATAWLVATLASFYAFHQPLYRRVAVVLAPSHIGDPGEYTRWTEELVDALDPEAIRFIAFDYRESLVFARCAQSRATRVRTVIAGLNMPAAYEEISKAAGVNSPPEVFRHTYLQMLNTMERDPIRAAELGSIAKKIAVEHNWLHLAFSVHYALGSSALHRHDIAKAIEDYRSANEIGAAMAAAGDAFGRKLQLRAQMACGTAYFVGETFEAAARTFEAAAPIAIEVEEAIFILECWRMAGVSYSRAECFDRAWDAGLAALAAGASMAPREREMSTLPFVGQDLMSLANRSRYSSYGPSIDAQLKELVGEDWRDRVGPAALDPDSPHPLVEPAANA